MLATTDVPPTNHRHRLGRATDGLDGLVLRRRTGGLNGSLCSLTLFPGFAQESIAAVTYDVMATPHGSARGAAVSIEPGVKRSGTPGKGREKPP
jgi:hypothetical protein